MTGARRVVITAGRVIAPHGDLVPGVVEIEEDRIVAVRRGTARQSETPIEKRQGAQISQTLYPRKDLRDTHRHILAGSRTGVPVFFAVFSATLSTRQPLSRPAQ